MRHRHGYKPPKRYVTVERKCGCNKSANCYSCKGTGIATSKEQMMLCIGGPFNRKMMHRSCLPAEYDQFNNASRGDNPVYIHRSILDRAK
jgi:hypothetical protein